MPPKNQSYTLERQALSAPIASLGSFFQNVPRTLLQVERLRKQQVRPGNCTNYHHLHE